MDDIKTTSLGCYGRERNTSPNLDALAGQGIRFERCIAQAAWSLPSYASVFTSRYPYETVFTREYLRHVRGETELARSRDPYRMPDMNRHWYGPLRPGIPTLAEMLVQAGFTTAAWTNNQWLAPAISGLDRGFGEYSFNDQPDAFARPADQTVLEAGDWIERHRGERFYVFVHLMDPHRPWQDHAEFGFGSRPLDLYESEIRFADRAIGALVDRLKRLEVWERTLVVLSSDHGEGIYEDPERFVGHGGGVVEDLIRVPLILIGPGLPRGKVVSATVRKLDIVPTILDLLGQEPGPELRGRSLAPLWSGKSRPRPEDYLPAVSMGMIKGPEQISVITGRWQVVLIPAYGSASVLPWGAEESNAALPAETQEQAAASAQQFVKAMLESMDKLALPAPMKIDPATEKKLKALGYLQ